MLLKTESLPNENRRDHKTRSRSKVNRKKNEKCLVSTLQLKFTISKAGNQLEKTVGSCGEKRCKMDTGMIEKLNEHPVLVVTGEATGETSTRIFVAYRSQELSQFELNTEEALC